jgi:hypothetical protein
MSLQKVRQAFAANRWLRWQSYLTCLIVANGIRVLAGWPTPATWWSVLLAPVLLVPFVGCMVMAFRLSDAQRRQREVEREAAAELRTLRAPNADPGQCPVCGMDDLDQLAADDGFMERGPDRSKVVAYGRRRAHRDCAEFVPYVPTEQEKARDIHYREHGQAQRVRDCDWCFTEDIRWEREVAQQRFEQSWPELAASASPGDRKIRISRCIDLEYRHWLIHEGAPTRHMDILTVTLCEPAPDGFDWIAHLAEPLRHPLYAVMGRGQGIEMHGRRMMPLDTERLWNREAFRPYKRTELGLCDCGPKRPEARLLTDKSYRSGSETAINLGRVFEGPEGEWLADCGPARVVVPPRLSDSEARWLAEIRRAAEAPCRPTAAEVEWRAQWRS